MKHSTLNKSLLLTKVELNLVFSTDACRGEFLLELIWRSEWRGSPSIHWSSQMKTQGGWRERERSEYFCSFALETKPFLNREITSYAKVSLESPTFL